MAEKEHEESTPESDESGGERIKDLDLPEEDKDDVTGGRGGDQEPLNLGLAP